VAAVVISRRIFLKMLAAVPAAAAMPIPTLLDDPELLLAEVDALPERCGSGIFLDLLDRRIRLDCLTLSHCFDYAEVIIGARAPIALLPSAKHLRLECETSDMGAYPTLADTMYRGSSDLSDMRVVVGVPECPQREIITNVRGALTRYDVRHGAMPSIAFHVEIFERLLM
jgi:hypothetical protein